jgi:hypothetical protein
MLSLNMLPNAATDFPVLHAFLKQEPQLHALRHLPAALQWNTMLLSRFSKRLEREKARQMTIAALFHELPEGVSSSMKYLCK